MGRLNGIMLSRNGGHDVHSAVPREDPQVLDGISN